MEATLILCLMAAAIIWNIIVFFFSRKNYNKYCLKLSDIMNRDYDPKKALMEIDNEIKRSNNVSINYLNMDKSFVLMWLGSWNEAEFLVSKVNVRLISTKRRYRIQFNKLILSFLSNDNKSIIRDYSIFSQLKYWKGTIALEFLTCLYSFHVERNYKEYLQLFQHIENNYKIGILYLGMLNLYAGSANYELGSTEEAIRNLTKAMVFGEKTFIKIGAKNMLHAIENMAESILFKKVLEDGINQANTELHALLSK